MPTPESCALALAAAIRARKRELNASLERCTLDATHDEDFLRLRTAARKQLPATSLWQSSRHFHHEAPSAAFATRARQSSWCQRVHTGKLRELAERWK
mgnify:CR=1 FL=1